MNARFRSFAVVLPFAALLSACASSPAPEAKTDEAPVAEAGKTEPAKPDQAKPALATTARSMASPRAAAAASAPKPARSGADEKVEEPLDQAQASGMCWMEVDKRTNLSLEQKAQFVDKCVDQKLAADRVKWSGQPKQ